MLNEKFIELRKKVIEKQFSKMNSMQRSAIFHTQGPLLVLAGAEAVFEGLVVRIPEHYSEYLTQKYGDYSQDPPIQEQVGHHYYKICDADRPYTYYTTRKDS